MGINDTGEQIEAAKNYILELEAQIEALKAFEVTADYSDEFADYREVFGRDPEPWRHPLGALILTLAGDPEKVDVMRAQHEVKELTRVLNEEARKA